MNNLGFNDDEVSIYDNDIHVAGGPSGARSNILSNKLSTVLSTSYADSQIRDALGLLDARAVRNNAEARRNLRLDAQREVIECNAQIVDDFGKVAEQLKRVGAMLATLNHTCDEMRKHINLAKHESAPMLDEATVLITNKQESQTKQDILDAFNKHFIISDEDLTTLTSSVEPVNERFFTALTRVKQIHKDCEALLGSENQRLGLELMEQTSRNLDAGFKKLYNWIQREFKGLDLEDPHISGSIRRALRVLSERPTLFQNCLNFFAEAREQTLSSAFQLALTESRGQSAKAIEFSTHDLLRYVGDMLAWVHSTTVSEKEALEGLFIADADEIAKSMKAGKGSEPWSRITADAQDSDDEDNEPAFDGLKALNTLVGRNLAGVCQTLQARIETAVSHSDEPALVYKVLNLLNFYRIMFAKQIGPDTLLKTVVSDLEAYTASHFERIVEEDNVAITADAVPASDLTPPPFLTNTLHQLVDLAGTKGPSMTLTEFEKLFSTLLSAALNTSAEMATTIQDPRRRTIFKLNYLSTVRAALTAASQAGVEAATPSLDRVAEEVENLKTQLVELLTQSFLEVSGVTSLLQEVASRHDAAVRRQWLRSNLEEYARQLDAFLPSALMDAQDHLKALVERTTARDIIADAVEGFCGEFDEVESLVERESEIADGDGAVNGVEEVEEEEKLSSRELYPRTSAEVRALLS